MPVLDKVMFWKKKDDDMGSLPKLDEPPSLPSMGAPDFQSVHGLNHQEVPIGAPLGASPTMDHTSAYAAPNPYIDNSLSSQGQQPQYLPQAPQGHRDDNLLSKELEIISTKLDYLKASLENINQKLANIEAAGKNENIRQRW